MLQELEPEVEVHREHQARVEAADRVEVVPAEHDRGGLTDRVTAVADDAGRHGMTVEPADEVPQPGGGRDQRAVVVDQVPAVRHHGESGVGVQDLSLPAGEVGVQQVVGADHLHELAATELDGPVPVVRQGEHVVVVDQPDPRVAAAADDLGGLVGARVVQDQDLEVGAGLGEHVPQRRGQVPLRLVGGDADGDGRRGHHRAPSS